MLTLQLNISCEPIRLITWQEAITLWYTGKVEVMASYDSPCRSMTIEMLKPAVVKLTRSYHRHNFEVPLDRWHLFARDAWTCQYCGKRYVSKDLTFDHVMPQSRGGRTSWLNIVAACHSCNQRKANRTPREADMPLLRKPLRPRWMPWLLARTIRLDQVPEEWLDWISWIPRTSGHRCSARSCDGEISPRLSPPERSVPYPPKITPVSFSGVRTDAQLLKIQAGNSAERLLFRLTLVRPRLQYSFVLRTTGNRRKRGVR